MAEEPPEKVCKIDGKGRYTITTIHSKTDVVTISPMVTVNVLKEAIAQQFYDGDITCFRLFYHGKALLKETPLYEIPSTDFHLVFCRAGESY
jgi:hypothetical protein